MNFSTIKKTHWLDVAETVAVFSSIAGSITSVIVKQFFWVTIPLSASTTLALLNHQRLKKLIESGVLKEQIIITNAVAENQKEITTFKEEYQEKHHKNKTNIAELVDELGQVKNFATTELARLQKEGQNNFNNTTKDLDKIQASLAQLDNLSHRLTEDLEQLDRKQKETGKLVRELKAIDIFTQNIKAELNSVQSYFERGLAYQRLGNKNRAIDDYSKTIELSDDHAKAYHNRGLLYLELGINQKAILDLRKASQLYFDKGDIDKYRETRDLSQTVYQEDKERVDAVENNQTGDSEKVIVGNLFG